MKTRWRIVLGLFAIALFFAFAIFILQRKGRSELLAYQAELRSKGEKLTFAELNIRQGTNDPSFDKFVETTTALGRATSQPWTLDLFQFEAPARVVVLTDNGSNKSWQELRIDFQTFSNEFATLHKLAQSVPLDPDWDITDPMVSRVDVYVAKRTAAQWLSIAAVVENGEGNCDAASDHLSACIGASRLFENDFYLPSQMVQQSMNLMALYATWQILNNQTCQMSDDDLQRLQTEWQRVDTLALMERSFEWERVLFAVNIAAAANTPSQSPMDYLWKSVAKDNNELLHLKYLSAEIDDVRNVAKENQGAKALRQHQLRHADMQSRTNLIALYRSSLALIALANHEKILPRTLQVETFRRLAIAALALERYKLRHGKFPQDLQALVPDFIATTPMDCMDGKPLRYKLNSNGSFLLYSVGEDGIDNGGDPNPSRATKKIDLWSGSDTVWPVPTQRSRGN